MIDKDYIIQALSNLHFTDGVYLVNVISAIVIRGQHIGFSVEVDSTKIVEAEKLRMQATKLLEELTGYNITIVITNAINGHDVLIRNTTEHNRQKAIVKDKISIPGVKKIICVASGKGGVGKSTIVALIAQTLKLKNYKVGIVDLDILGPSIPQIFGLQNSQVTSEDNKFIPVNSKGVKIMSIGLLIGQTQSLVWRGPMISKTINQLLYSTNWAADGQTLDFLIVDTPPGTGDIHLSLLEKYNIDQVLIVSTPQELSVIDAAKSLDMYRKFNISILGIIENMAFLNSKTQEKILIFGQGGGQKLAKQYNVSLLDTLPFDPDIVGYCDSGEWFNTSLVLDKTIDLLDKL